MSAVCYIPGETPGSAEAPRLFGTDGIRMVVGREITPEFVALVARALGTQLEGKGEVVIARDFRISSEAISRIFIGSLLMTGVNVRDMGVMPTPCLQFNVKAVGATMGVTVTASHNPTEFNGIKFTGGDGLELPRTAEEAIERAVHTGNYVNSTWERIGRLRVDNDGIDRYLRSILEHTELALIQAWTPTVVLDPGNGTSAVTSPELLRRLGCRVITLNSNPDGHFPGRPSEPIEENLDALKRAVVEFNADLGIAHDGDSDRVAFVDEKGRFLSGDIPMALFARERLSQNPGATIATSVTSSTLVEDVVRREGGQTVITRSGSLPVAVGIQENRGVFGGEENGHYYWPEHQNAPDGPMSSARMVELLARLRRPLSELVSELPRYHVAKTKVPLGSAGKELVVARAREDLVGEADRLVTLDGVKAFYSDGWVLIRPSGTEPICRVYAESRSPTRTEELLHHGVELVERAMGSAPLAHV